MNVYVIEHHDIYESPKQLCVFVGTRRDARAEARSLPRSRGVVTERYLRVAQYNDIIEPVEAQCE
jgi:hypothetical protein